jgi:hypothetical protein
VKGRGNGRGVVAVPEARFLVGTGREAVPNATRGNNLAKAKKKKFLLKH